MWSGSLRAADFRLEKLAGAPVWSRRITPPTRTLDEAWRRLTRGHDEAERD